MIGSYTLCLKLDALLQESLKLRLEASPLIGFFDLTDLVSLALGGVSDLNDGNAYEEYLPNFNKIFDSLADLGNASLAEQIAPLREFLIGKLETVLGPRARFQFYQDVQLFQDTLIITVVT